MKVKIFGPLCLLCTSTLMVGTLAYPATELPELLISGTTESISTTAKSEYFIISASGNEEEEVTFSESVPDYEAATPGLDLCPVGNMLNETSCSSLQEDISIDCTDESILTCQCPIGTQCQGQVRESVNLQEEDSTSMVIKCAFVCVSEPGWKDTDRFNYQMLRHV